MKTQNNWLGLMNWWTDWITWTPTVLMGSRKALSEWRLVICMSFSSSSSDMHDLTLCSKAWGWRGERKFYSSAKNYKSNERNLNVTDKTLPLPNDMDAANRGCYLIIFILFILLILSFYSCVILLYCCWSLSYQTSFIVCLQWQIKCLLSYMLCVYLFLTLWAKVSNFLKTLLNMPISFDTN